MVRVPKKIVLISHLHVLSSTVLNDVKLCFGTGKWLNISASVLESCLVRMLLTCSVPGFPLSAMLSESRVDLHMLSQIGADQRREGSSEKRWFGTANRLHCTPYPSWARFSGSRTNFIRARTTSRHGPSTGESLVQHGWGKVVYTTKSIRAESIFLVRVLFSSEPCQNFSAV